MSEMFLKCGSVIVWLLMWLQQSNGRSVNEQCHRHRLKKTRWQCRWCVRYLCHDVAWRCLLAA